MPDSVPSTTNSAAPAATPDAPASTLMTAPDSAPAPVTDSKPVEAEAAKEAKYEIEAPEGYDKDAFIKFAKDNKIDPKMAQALLDREIETSLSAMEALKKEYAKRDYREQASGWVESLKKDKEFGGESFAANASRVSAYVRANMSQEAIQVLNESGLGNHPALVKDFLKLAKLSGSDTLSNPNTNPVKAEASSSYRDMFPSLNNLNQ